MRSHYLTLAEHRDLWGADIIADCGKVVRNAQPLAMVDRNSDCYIAGKNLCQRCQQTKITTTSLRWEYLIAEGQAAIDEAVTA